MSQTLAGEEKELLPITWQHKQASKIKHGWVL